MEVQATEDEESISAEELRDLSQVVTSLKADRALEEELEELKEEREEYREVRSCLHNQSALPTCMYITHMTKQLVSSLDTWQVVVPNITPCNRNRFSFNCQEQNHT